MVELEETAVRIEVVRKAGKAATPVAAVRKVEQTAAEPDESGEVGEVQKKDEVAEADGDREHMELRPVVAEL